MLLIFKTNKTIIGLKSRREAWCHLACQNVAYSWNKEWLRTEQKQELIQKVKEKRNKVISLSCDLFSLFLLY